MRIPRARRGERSTSRSGWHSSPSWPAGNSFSRNELPVAADLGRPCASFKEIVVVVTVTTTIDLTPFGFTQTESRVYNALLGLGPTSGYAVARALGIARANAYHAITALQTKGALTVLAERPLRVRAIRADALIALVSARHGERLEALDDQ